ncbi:MAG: RsmB/NOP family class I SAM-dependent RNA methyltransferase, partial [Deltaproteobacteria bacterium]|nr:RsmB/NOP family class I SAM-dependent RNA methyltransferase [Deltaproteobacteria bacterium]
APRSSLNPSDDRFYIQDEASQLVALLLSPAPGDNVLDACSAPGGKTTHLAALMKNEGILVALDKDKERLKRVSLLASRFDLGIIKTFSTDLEMEDNLERVFEKTVKMGVSKEGFDSVLVDAPCSGLGVLGRTPDIKYSRKEEDVLRLAVVQARLLENLAKVVRPGGVLVYSVCTTEPEETVDVVENFLKKNADFILEDPSGYLPSSVLEFVTEDGFLITLPSGDSTANKKHMDAFFAVRLRRTR